MRQALCNTIHIHVSFKNRIANAVVILGSNLNVSSGPVTISAPQVAIRAQAVQPGDTPSFDIATGSDGNFGDDPFATSDAPAATINVPAALTNFENVDRLTVTSFTNDALFQARGTTVGSVIIGLDAATAAGSTVVITGLEDNPVIFSFTVDSNVDEAQCSFYDTESKLCDIHFISFLFL